jgi:hypothetical protein
VGVLKAYDVLEVQREFVKRRYIPHIPQRGEEKESIKIGYPKVMGRRKNKFLA